MRSLDFLFISLLCIVSCSQVEKESYDLVIENGNIIHLETGKIEQETIFISNGRIQKVSNSNDSFTFSTKKKIDATGKYILPGFWDNHVHFRGGDSLITANKNFLNLFIANGITTVRDAGGDMTSSILDWRKQINDNDLIGPKIFTSGPKIDGVAPTWAGSLEVNNERDISNALDILQRIPSDFVKIYDSKISGENYIKVIEAAEKRDLITSGHMPFTVTLNQTVHAGIDAVEHLYYIMKGCSSNEIKITQQLINKEIGFWQAMPELQKTYADSSAQKTFSILKNNNVYVVPTLHIGKTLSYLDEVDHSNDSYLKYMSNGIIKSYEGRIQRVRTSSKKAIKDRKNLDAFFGKLSKSLHEAGVGLLAGSDSGAFNSYTYPGISLHKELEEMVSNGIPPIEALKTSAYNGAKFLKQDIDYGIIKSGKISDLVLLDQNPLKDIKNTQEIYMVIKEGKTFSKKELQELLDNAIAQ